MFLFGFWQNAKSLVYQHQYNFLVVHVLDCSVAALATYNLIGLIPKLKTKQQRSSSRNLLLFEYCKQLLLFKSKSLFQLFSLLGIDPITLYVTRAAF